MSAATELLQKGRYRIDSSASAPAGNGSVLPAYDTTSNSKVYVKEIVVRLGKVTTLSQQENSRLAFENAAKRIAEFRHESLLQVKDYYAEVGRQYLVLEDVGGEDLQSAFAASRSQHSFGKVLEWADNLLDAVNYLHQQKVLHGGLCPKNVWLTPSGSIKLLGVTIKDDSGNDLSTALADVNDGTLNYFPLEAIWESLDAASQKVIVSSYDDRSEKLLKEPADVRSDIYSLGATLYFLLTGRVPVDPLERSIELLEGRRDPLVSPHSVDSSVPPEVSDVVMRSLEIKREDRFDSAMIMRQVLRTSVVRAKEREAGEEQEMNEAAELMGSTKQLKMSVAVAEPPAPVADPQPSDAEILAQKLKEAEELRLEAERKMAEAQKLLREQEAERARLEAQAKAIHSSMETAPKISAEDDLLGISLEPVRTAPNAVQHDIGDADEDIHLSAKPTPRAKIDLREIAKKSEPAQQQVAIETLKAPEAAPQVEPDPEAFLIEPDAEDYQIYDSENYQIHDSEPARTFSYANESRRSGLSVPLIAGVAVAILVVAGLGFVFLGGSSSSNASQDDMPAPVQQQQQAAAPAAQPEQPVAEQPPATQSQPEQLNTFTETPPPTDVKPEAVSTETRPAAKPAQTPKKAEPAKTPAAKKPVTVDDLINDN